MIHILERLNAQAWRSGYRYLTMRGPTSFAKVSRHEVIDLEPQGFGILNEHIYEITLGINFRCTDTTLGEMTLRAEKDMMDVLYGDITRRLHKALTSIMSEDKASASEQVMNLIHDYSPSNIAEVPK